ncbi:hypothetical protein ACVWYS_000841 [Arthrobacter sp. TE12231]
MTAARRVAPQHLNAAYGGRPVSGGVIRANVPAV